MYIERLSQRKDHKKILKAADFPMRFNALFLFFMIYLFLAITLTGTIYTLGKMQQTLEYAKYAIIFLSVFGLFILWALNRLRILMLIGEFQSMLCAGALSLHAKFTVICDPTGLIVYADGGFSRCYGMRYLKRGIRRIPTILQKEGLDENGMRGMNAVINDGINQQINFDFRRKKDASPEPLTLVIQCLNRPEGYFVLRGYPRLKKKQ
jgi:hypothetical protein